MYREGLTWRCRVVNILVRYRCNWSRSSILVSRSQLLTFLIISGKCVFPLPSSLCCEVEFWTSWSHNSTGNSKVCNHQICVFRNCCKSSLGGEFQVWLDRTQYSIHHHKNFIFRDHDGPRVLYEGGFHFWRSLHGSLFSISQEKKM